MSGWKFEYQLRDNSLGYTGRTTMDNDRPLAERVARLEAALAQLTARYERGATEPADPPGTQCGEPSPYTHDKCQEIKGHTHAHHAGLLDAWERTPSEPQPYRMTRPTSRDALVIDGGKVWRPVFGPDGMWEADGGEIDWAVWETFTDPHPYQNCTLTADDPEPPIGSVVLDRDRGMWQRLSLVWYLAGLDVRRGWNGLRAVGPVTLLYRGEA